jgi:hypothetical protein
MRKEAFGLRPRHDSFIGVASHVRSAEEWHVRPLGIVRSFTVKLHVDEDSVVTCELAKHANYNYSTRV